MPSVLNWPSRGEWLLSNPKSPLGRNASGFYHKADPPFAVLTVDFRSKTGTVRALQGTTALSGIQLRQTADGPKFPANYAIGTNTGRFEATVFARYELEIDFTGTAVTNVNAHPSTIDGGDDDVASLSTQDKLQEAVRRALPLLPSEMAREVAAIFTPTALAIMAAMAALWTASHLAVVGEIADIALPITGGILMGRAAIDVGGDLAEFMTGATGATTHQELDDAAQHFAAAVLKGRPLLVGTLALSKSAGNLQRRLSAPARPGELPKNNNMVPPSKLPAASRSMTAAIQGEQPSLGGLAQDEAGLVRGLLDKFRREDLTGRPTDCKAAADALKAASGGKGIVQESASGYTPHVPGIEHTDVGTGRAIRRYQARHVARYLQDQSGGARRAQPRDRGSGRAARGRRGADPRRARALSGERPRAGVDRVRRQADSAIGQRPRPYARRTQAAITQFLRPWRRQEGGGMGTQLNLLPQHGSLRTTSQAPQNTAPPPLQKTPTGR